MSDQLQPPPVGQVGLALIVRNEQHTLPTLLDSIELAFDEIALLDTGCTDQTLEVFEAWCAEEGARNPSFSYTIQPFEWVDDFAAARNACDALLRTPWRVWADADDEIAGARNLRAIAASAPDHVGSFIFDYDYAHDAHGNVACVLKRERLVRAGVSRWEGRVHEAQTVQANQTLIGRGTAVWVHRKPDEQAGVSNDRNLRILTAWDQDRPDDPRVVAYLGTECLVRGDHDEAVRRFRQYLGLKTGWDQERAQIHRKLSVSLMATGRHQEALETALAAMMVVPDWPDSHLTIAQANYALGEHAKAAHWAREVLRLGQPESMLILNPLDYSFHPRLILAGALGAIGDMDAAIAVGEEALAIVPDHSELRAGVARWKGNRKRSSTAQSWCAAAHLLVEHDEQLKALTLLEDTVPHFVQDHPDVVRARSEIRERLLWANDPAAYADHYGTGGTNPEAAHTDEQALAVCEQLPRAHFLVEGLREQLAEAA